MTYGARDSGSEILVLSGFPSPDQQAVTARRYGRASAAAKVWIRRSRTRLHHTNFANMYGSDVRAVTVGRATSASDILSGAEDTALSFFGRGTVGPAASFCCISGIKP